MKNKIDEELVKRNLLRKLKELYKEGPLVSRIVNRIPLYGTHPNWGTIKKYSVQELDFLIKLSSGDTLGQTRRKLEIEKNQAKTLERVTFKELTKQAEVNNLRNWKTFTAALGNKDRLTKEMQDSLLIQTVNHSEYQQIESMGRRI